jgi:uncharacterized membrane protein
MYNRPWFKQLAREQIRGNIGTILGGNIVVALVVAFASFIIFTIALTAFLASAFSGINFAAAYSEPFEFIVSFVGALANVGMGALITFMIVNIAGSCATMPITLSRANVYVGLTYAKTPTIGDFFSGYRTPFRAIGATLLIGIFTALWMCLFIIPGYVKAIAYSMTFCVLADNPEMSPLDAISESKRLTQGYKMDIFVTYLSFIGWMLIGAIPIIGQIFVFIYVVPYIEATNANIYRFLKEQKSEVKQSPENRGQTIYFI